VTEPPQRIVIPASPPEGVLGFNDRIRAEAEALPNIWEVGAPVARQSREEGRSIFGTLASSDRAESIMIDGRAGPIDLRVIRADEPRGVLLHIHGGGWVLGANHHADLRNEWLVDDTGLTVVATSYRLAPEHPYPAGPDDCEAAASWLVENAEEVFGTDHLAIGGESAGAQLALVTMLRLRDRLGHCPFALALLTYGCYDLRGTPSVRAFGERPLVLSTPMLDWFFEQFLAGADPNDSDVSPLFADLAGLPPALFTVGDADPLFDDSTFGFERYRAAGNDARLDVWPGAIHAWDYFDNEYGRMGRESIHEFVNDRLA